MAFLTREQKENIAEAIRRAEARTSGEFVAVIARESDDYLYIPLLWAALLALALPGALLYLGLFSGQWDLTLYQVVTFAVAALLFRWRPIKHLLIPHDLAQRRAALRAREQFLLHNLHATTERNGILFYVSEAEHYVELIADTGVDTRVPKGTWDLLVSQFIAAVQAGRIEQGYIDAIDRCGTLLAQHFPVGARDLNELPNHLIELG